MARSGRPQFVFPRITSAVKTVVVTLLVAYVVQLVLDNWVGFGVASLLALDPAGAGIWQLVTYVLIDMGHPLMFLLGLVLVWWAMSPFEIGYGPRRTLQLCAVATLGASVPAYLTGFVLPGSPPLFGSSALWFGAISATTWLQRSREMSLFGLGAMSGRQFLWLLVGLSVLMFLASKNHTHLVANFGAMGAGIGFARWLTRPRGPSRLRPRRSDAARSRGFKVIKGGGTDNGDRPKWLN